MTFGRGRLGTSHLSSRPLKSMDIWMPGGLDDRRTVRHIESLVGQN